MVPTHGEGGAMDTAIDRRGAAQPEPAGGSGEEPEKPQLGWRHVLYFVGLFALNYLVASMILGSAAKASVTIPYSPTFIGQVRAGNVTTITATGSEIRGTLEHGIRYPADDAN